jgi:hypothetical protein
VLFRKTGNIFQFAEQTPVPQRPFKPAKRLVKSADDEAGMNIGRTFAFRQKPEMNPAEEISFAEFNFPFIWLNSMFKFFDSRKKQGAVVVSGNYSGFRHADFSAQKIHTLNAGSSLLNRVNVHVVKMLFHGKVLSVSA